MNIYININIYIYIYIYVYIEKAIEMAAKYLHSKKIRF